MLKLEKTSSLSGFTVRMRERERFFEPRLLKALAIALILHCIGLFLFQVTPFFVSSTFIFAPLHVQSDHPLQGVSTLATFYQEEEDLFPPIEWLPHLDWLFLTPEPSFLYTEVMNNQFFTSTEERIWPKWEAPLSFPLEEPKIRLAIAGDLAELTLASTDPLLQQMQPFSTETSPSYITYQVQVDETTGELFWYERLVSSGMPALDNLTEKILLNLRFYPPRVPEPVTGTLHFWCYSH